MSHDICEEPFKLSNSSKYQHATILKVKGFLHLTNGAIATVANILVLLAIKKNSSMHTPSYILLFTLAVTDLGTGLTIGPMFVAESVCFLNGHFHASCKLLQSLLFCTAHLTCMTLLTLAAISCDRFLAVLLRSRYRTTVTTERVIVTVLFCWIYSLFYASTVLVDVRGISPKVIALTVGCCLFTITFNYFNSIRLLRKIQAQIHFKTGKFSDHFNVSSYKKSTTSMIGIYILFLVCTLPLFGTVIVFNIDQGTNTPAALYMVMFSQTFQVMNSSANPVMYYFRMSKVRREIKTLLHCLTFRYNNRVRTVSITQSGSAVIS